MRWRVFTLCLVIMLFYPVLSCEDETHYMKGDKCCKMCGPGKRMMLDDNCEDPRCQDCQVGEYQSGYTHETKCERQPSCDPNLHFLPQSIPSKTELSKCQCKHGYYCSAEDDCSTCRKHTVCSPGQIIVKNGTSISDTSCAACKIGTFSSHHSADNCYEWKTCDTGYVEGTPGSLTSDRTCVMATRSYRTAIFGVVLVFLVLIVASALMIFIRKRKMRSNTAKHGKEIIKHGDNRDVTERQDRPFIRQPQEDVDISEPVSPSPSNVTENGNVVVQEDGKHSISPSSETHPSSGNSFFY
ncbi:tumor necrosis factor receptor superfamily member 5 isoform X2 [Myxocyprinus asiaticus]|uniref:tumor necrosis factor receptor superfamily member 5 isoform X2 n=1 Tax=Myxocyprinus asiaticus TaxID=70543 RepID=UPI0022222E17|nr:tumor necrosis factor receptor superfamily member 5 isoform X2 [Myxocyprinus asiaticus]